MIREKNHAYSKWMAHKFRRESDIYRLEYTRLRNRCQQMCRREKRRYEWDIAEQAKVQPKAFWRFSKHKLKTNSGIAPLLENPEDPSTICHKDKEKAEILQKQFSSVFTSEPVGPTPQHTGYVASSLVTPLISRASILKKLSAVNISKSCGPDEIHPRIIKELSTYIAGPIATLYRKSIDLGELPLDWKEALIAPIYKKGAKKIAANYRPISLTSILCKILESVICEALIDHLCTNNALSPKQYGFIHGRSTVLQLLHYLDYCSEVVARGGVVDAVYLDYSKAFDSVPHRRLLSKLENYGVRGKTLTWINHFLIGRYQTVVVNGEKSSRAPVLSGIPQGSVLGPLLFIVYINDLPETVASNLYMFADDTKIVKQITNRQDSYALQYDLDNMQNWSDDWLLCFNPSKCKVMSLGAFENIIYAHRYTLHGQELEHVDSEKDLGVIVDSSLRFEEHILQKIKLANSMMGLIRRVFSCLRPRMFTPLYTAFVRSHLEYAQVAWSPRYRSLENKIEQVQVRATALVDGLKHVDYSERLKHLNIPTLRYRRHRGDMLELWKHFNVYNKEILPASFKPLERPSRRHNKQLYQHRPVDGAYGIQRNSFYHRTITMWNSLPPEVAEAETINSFKNRLDDHWRDMEFKFNAAVPPPQPPYGLQTLHHIESAA